MEEKQPGLALDGTQYSAESPEVVKFRELFPDVTEEAAIGSVVEIHDNIVESKEIAGDAKEVEEMIRQKLLADSEEIDSENAEEKPETDGLDTSEGVKEPGETSDEAASETAAADTGVVDPATVNQIKE